MTNVVMIIMMASFTISFERHLTGKSVEKSVEEITDCLDKVNETFEKEKEDNMRQIKSLGMS